jgi:hypothetical protein
MKAAQMTYGFHSANEQTIFLKQERSQQGNWVLYFSPIILHTAEGARSLTTNIDHAVSLRECFLHIMILATNNYTANNTVTRHLWIQRKKKQNYRNQTTRF